MVDLAVVRHQSAKAGALKAQLERLQKAISERVTDADGEVVLNPLEDDLCDDHEALPSALTPASTSRGLARALATAKRSYRPRASAASRLKTSRSMPIPTLTYTLPTIRRPLRIRIFRYQCLRVSN